MRTLFLRWLLARETDARFTALERDVEDRVTAATSELTIAQNYITLRGWRDDYEVYAVAERRAARKEK